MCPLFFLPPKQNAHYRTMPLRSRKHLNHSIRTKPLVLHSTPIDFHIMSPPQSAEALAKHASYVQNLTKTTTPLAATRLPLVEGAAKDASLSVGCTRIDTCIVAERTYG